MSTTTGGFHLLQGHGSFQLLRTFVDPSILAQVQEVLDLNIFHDSVLRGFYDSGENKVLHMGFIRVFCGFIEFSRVL